MNISRNIRKILERRARKSVLSNEALRQLVTTSSPSTGASFYDYHLLYQEIKKLKPREVLELGPGITTLVIAQALSENGFGRVTAMEDVQMYYDALDGIIPDELRPYIDLRLSPSHEVHWGPFRGKAYQSIPEREYDFAWVDGPNYDKEHEFDADIVQIVSKSPKPIKAYIDNRVGSCFFYGLIFGKKFRYDHVRHIGILNASQHDIRTYTSIYKSMKSRGAIYGLFGI